MQIMMPPGRPVSDTLRRETRLPSPQFAGLLGKTTSVETPSIADGTARENKFRELWKRMPFPEHVKGFSDTLQEQKILHSQMSRVKQLWQKVNTLVAHSYEPPVYRIYVSDEAGRAEVEKVIAINAELASGLNLEIKMTPGDKCAAGKPHLWQDTRIGRERIQTFYDILELARPKTRRKVHAVGLQVMPNDREQPVIFALVQDQKARQELEALFSEHHSRMAGTPCVFEVREIARLA